MTTEREALAPDRRRRLKGLANDPTVGRVSAAVFRELWAAFEATEAGVRAAQAEALAEHKCRPMPWDDASLAQVPNLYFLTEDEEDAALAPTAEEAKP